MVYTKEERRRIWLGQADIAARKMGKLLQIYGDTQELWDAFSPAMEKALGESTYRTLAKYHGEQEMEDVLSAMAKVNVRALFPGSEGYPPLLESISCPPPVLYALGDPNILSGRAIALVGTRTPSRYGKDMAYSLGRELGKKVSR